MAETKTASQAAEKWSRVTPERTADYEQGVKNPRTDWQQATAAAESRFKEGVIKAANDGRFGKGVARAGSAKWQRGAIEKGVSRFGPGVLASASNYAQAIAPVLDVISRTTLPPRYPRGDSRNIQRVAALASALHKLKTA